MSEHCTIAKHIPALAAGLRLFQRGHKKSPSDFDLKYGRDTTPPSSPLKGGQQCRPAPPTLDPDCWEVRSFFFYWAFAIYYVGQANAVIICFMGLLIFLQGNLMLC